jgi:dTDP-4-dehydrorhamnose 3,5-epimerase
MEITTVSLPGVSILKPKRLQDGRGFFCETYNKQRMQEAGIDVEFIQDNVSLSQLPGTLRGLHFQAEPFAQAKLVSVVKGAALDVVVDLRRSSPTFGQHFSIELSEAEGNQVFIPVGFAHGFLTLAPDTLFAYKVSEYYAPDHDTGIRFDDDVLSINWGEQPDLIVASDKDLQLPCFDPNAKYFA